MISTMNFAKLPRHLGLFLGMLLFIFAAPVRASFTDSYVKAIEAQLKHDHAGNGKIATASVSQLNTALNQVLGASASAKANAASYLKAILGNRADAAAIDGVIAQTAVNAAHSSSSGAVGAVLVALNYASDKSALLSQMAANQKDTILDILAQGAVKANAHNSIQAGLMLAAILNSPGVSLKNASEFAIFALEGGPSSTMAKTVAEVVAVTRFASNKATFAKQFAAGVSASFAPSIAIGVAHTVPNSYLSVVAAVVGASSKTTAAAASIASAMAGSMQLEFAYPIVNQIAKSIHGSASFASLAPSIANQVAKKIDAKVDRSSADRAQEVASEAFALINALKPGDAASKTKVCAVVTQVAKAIASMDSVYADAVIGSLYTAIEVVQSKADYLSAVANAFVNALPSSWRQDARTAIANAKSNRKFYTTTPLPSNTTPVVVD